MKKILLAVITLSILVSIFYLVYKISTFSLFEVVRNKVMQIDIPNKSYHIEIFCLPSNATSQNYIQVVQVKNNNEKIITNYQRYNLVTNYKVLNDTLTLVLCDTNSLNKKNDTLFIKLL